MISKHKIKWLIGLLAALLLGLIAGCGGGGGSTGSSSGVSMFVTDNLDAGYDHVWIRIHEIELEHSGGSTKVFDSSAGQVVDLRALNNGSSNLFQFLGVSSFPSQPVTSIKFTVGRNLELFTTGATTSTTAAFASTFDLPNGKSRFTVTPGTPISATAGSSVTFDFDLSQWNLSGGFVTPVVTIFSGSGLDNPANHINEDFKGTVSNLGGTSPNFTMTVTTASGSAVPVRTDVNTVILNSNGAPSPTIANGKVVEVRGTFSTTTRAFLATVVKIEDGPANSDEDKVKGLVRNANFGSLQFEVKAELVRGFLPSDLWVLIQTNSSTRFFNRGGVVITAQEFFAALSSGSAEVEGTYDSNTNTMTALKAKLEDGAGDDGYQEARGGATLWNESAGTISISMSEWEGFAGSLGGNLNITTNGSTQYRDENGTTVSKATFFGAITAGRVVKVEGTYSGGTILAKRVEFRNSGGGGGGGGGNDPHEIHGYLSNINPEARSFTVTLVSWSGFNGGHGTQINVTMNSNATYRNDNGDSINQATFFAALLAGGLVEVDGSVSGSNMTGVKAKLDDD
ncbi:MAG: DUF4382 domain-containing protein [Fimbriimonadaceae bacterium]|nr:DUF4382 domain-containing protein [Fimbriimonadaceae bacterium]